MHAVNVKKYIKTQAGNANLKAQYSGGRGRQSSNSPTMYQDWFKNKTKSKKKKKLRLRLKQSFLKDKLFFFYLSRFKFCFE